MWRSFFLPTFKHKSFFNKYSLCRVLAAKQSVPLFRFQNVVEDDAQVFAVSHFFDGLSVDEGGISLRFT